MSKSDELLRILKQLKEAKRDKFIAMSSVQDALILLIEQQLGS